MKLHDSPHKQAYEVMLQPEFAGVLRMLSREARDGLIADLIRDYKRYVAEQLGEADEPESDKVKP